MLRFEFQVEAAEQATGAGPGTPKSDERKVEDGPEAADEGVPGDKKQEQGQAEVLAEGPDEEKAESHNDEKSDEDGDGKPLSARRARAAEARAAAKAKGTEFILCLCGPHSFHPPRNPSARKPTPGMKTYPNQVVFRYLRPGIWEHSGGTHGLLH